MIRKILSFPIKDIDKSSRLLKKNLQASHKNIFPININDY